MKRIVLSCILSACLILANPFTATSAGNETYLSEEIQGYCVEIGEMYGICPELLMAMVEKESSGNPKAENGSCKGLMQISERWHKDRMERLGVTDIYDEYGNIILGADYISELREDCVDISYVLDTYNGNSKAKFNYENGIMSKYSTWILNRSAELERIKEGDDGR